MTEVRESIERKQLCWRPTDWLREAGQFCSMMTLMRMLAAGEPLNVLVHRRMRVITESPADFFARKRAEQRHNRPSGAPAMSANKGSEAWGQKIATGRRLGAEARAAAAGAAIAEVQQQPS